MKNNKALKKIAENFLKSQEVIFSESWKDELVKRLISINSEFPEQQIRKLHNDMLYNLLIRAKEYLEKRFPKYEMKRIEDIVGDAFLKWYKYFDGTKSSEWNYFVNCVNSSQADDYERENPVLDTKPKTDQEGNIIFNESGEPDVEKIRALSISIDHTEKYNNENEDNENDNIDQESNSEIRSIKNLGNNSDDLEQIEMVQKEKNKKNYFSTKGHFKNTIELYDANRKDIKASQILQRFYLLKKKLISRSLDVPEFIPTYFPSKNFISSINNKPTINNHLCESSKYFLNRLEYIKSAEKRQWMELAIRELKKCRDAFENEINKGRFTKKDRKKIPILSAVAIDKDGRPIAHCYKGQIESLNENNEIRTFEKHCEYTLFKEVIKDAGEKDRLKGGTLFVTLEPCNKRGRDKIPCAVLCLEAGISKIYIGSYDTNTKVEKLGIEIMKTGKYKFELENGKHIGEKKEVDGAEHLEKIFNEKKCILLESDLGKRIYEIGSEIQIDFFSPDLIEDVCKINGYFLHNHRPDAFG